MCTTTEIERITSIPITDDEQVLAVLPMYFGHYAMRAESMVFNFMHHLCPEYHGGLWKYIQLSNGGFLMQLDDQRESLRIQVNGNGFDEDVSVEAASIIACLFAFCELANISMDAKITDLYYLLREYAGEHAQASLIFSAID